MGRGRWLRVGLWALVLVLGLQLGQFGSAVAARESHGFAAYYTAARLVREGADVSRFYDDDWFRNQVARFTPNVGDIYNLNPPTTALLLLPWSGLDHVRARVVWTLLSLACLTGAVGALLWLLPLRGTLLPGFVALVLLYQPLYANLRLGQAYLVLLALLVLAWYGYRHGRDWLLGLALGLVLALKTTMVPLWLLLAIQRRWRALGWGAGTVLAVAVASLPLLGVEGWRTYVRTVPSLHGAPELAVTAYQTQLSLWRHLFAFDAYWNPVPLSLAPALGSVLPWLGLLLLLGFSVRRAAGAGASDLTFAGFVALSLIVSPLSLDYHYVLLLPSLAVLLAGGEGSRSPGAGSASARGTGVLLAAAWVLIAAHLPYRAASLGMGAWALLAYPKLYGALLVWGLALWAHRGEATVHTGPAAVVPSARGLTEGSADEPGRREWALSRDGGHR